MKILFINNWNLDNSLTVSTTFPSLRVLSASDKIEEIVLVTPEYCSMDSLIPIEKVIHMPIRLESCKLFSLFKYICYELEYKKALLEIVKKYAFDKIIARGAPAGGRAWWLHKKTGIPFYVESFEPHADYMYEAGVWSKFDPRYLVQKYWEKGTIENASGLMPVADNYKNVLIQEGAKEENIQTIPCTVDIDIFAYNLNARHRIRQKLNIPEDSIVGIYVGKFGDIYYDEEAFESFETAFDDIQNFHLILLSPIPAEKLRERITQYTGINKENVHLFFVKQHEVPSYLSAADFAYEFHRTKPSTLFCSPIKVGEYWANGLPIIISKGVGDDAQIIKEAKAGGIFELETNNYKQALAEVLYILNRNHKEAIVQLAQQYRSRQSIEEGYRNLGFIK